MTSESPEPAAPRRRFTTEELLERRRTLVQAVSPENIEMLRMELVQIEGRLDDRGIDAETGEPYPDLVTTTEGA